MYKIVNIKTTRPIRTIRPAILQSVEGIKLTIGDIRRVIYSRALVDEVLSDGSTVRLTLDNYDKVNEKIKAPVKKEEEPKFEMPEEEPKVEQPKEEKKPQVSNKQEAKQNNNQNNNNKKNKER